MKKAMVLALMGPLCGTALAEGEVELAKQLSNPVAALISVPIQLNYDSVSAIPSTATSCTSTCSR